VKLGDFGIAKTNVERRRETHGIIKGKLGYLAPEQVASAHVDPRTDIFAAGVVLWELLAGRRLFSGGVTREILLKVLKAQIPVMPEGSLSVSPELWEIVSRALAKVPDKRFMDAHEFGTELQKYAESARLKYGFRDLRNFLQSVFEDRIREDTAAIECVMRHAGRIEDRSVVKVVTGLVREKADGLLVMEKGEERRGIGFHAGSMRFAASSMKEELLGEYLIRHEMLTKAQLDSALRLVRGSGAMLGDTLVSMGFLPPHMLHSVLQGQMREKLGRTFSWTEGAYLYQNGQELPGTSMQLNIGAIALILEGVRLYMPGEQLQEALGRLMDKPVKVSFDDVVNADTLSLQPRELRILRMLQAGRTLTQILKELATGGRLEPRDILALPYTLYEMETLKFG
jgi:hypothetical protein